MPVQTTQTPTIRSIYSPEGNEKVMLQRVYTRYDDMRFSDERKQAEKEWERGRKQWEAAREDRDDDEWQSNHYVPMTTSVVETALSEVIDKSPQPQVFPRGKEDISQATVMGHAFQYSWEVSDSDLEFEDIVHDAFIEGTGIGQEYYYSDIRKIKTSKKEGKNDEWNEEDQVDYNDCYLEAVKNDDFFIDEFARSFRGTYAARDCIRRYHMHIDDFRQFFKGPIWDPLNNAKYVKEGSDDGYYEWYKPPSNVDMSKMVEVLWYWSEKPDDWLCIVANDVMVVMGPNPYKHKKLPFARAVDVKRTHKFYGKGQAALLESIQDELNVLRRMVIDRNHLDIDKMFIGSNRLNLPEEDLIARPHGLIETDDKDAIKAVEYGDVPRSVELSMGHLEDDATIVTGINPRAQALPTTGTATEAAILKESTLKRIRLKVRRMEREFLTRIARLRVSNILQYYKQPKLEKIEGEVGTKQFEQEKQDLESKGLLEVKTTDQGEEYYKKKYKEIRLENIDLVPNAEGGVVEKGVQGFSFFELNPKYFLPNRGSFDIKFSAGSTLPISKALLKQEDTELYDRLIELSLKVPGMYDPKKIADMLIRSREKNPADFSVEQPQQQDDQQKRLEMAIELANIENDLLMRGKPIPPTPFASVAHTSVHVALTKSPEFQALKKESKEVKETIAHVTGELMAQMNREANNTGTSAQMQQAMTGGGAQVAQPQIQSKSQGGGNRALNGLLPDKIQGGGQVPAAV